MIVLLIRNKSHSHGGMGWVVLVVEAVEGRILCYELYASTIFADDATLDGRDMYTHAHTDAHNNDATFDTVADMHTGCIYYKDT